MILAGAGLQRLGLNANGQGIDFEGSKFFAATLPREVFVPAGGQGVIAMQIRSDNDQLREIVNAVNDFDTRLSLRAEREFLRLLDADCNQPVGILATIEDATMKIRAQIFDLGATTPRQHVIEGPSEDAEKLAAQLFNNLRA
jgi:porphobilinogen deaminase